MTHKYAPGYVKLRYSGAVQPHTQKFGIKFDGTPTPGVDPMLDTTGGTPVLFSTAIETFIDTAMAPQFATNTVFGFADIYAVDPDTGLQQFIYSVNTTNLGTNVAAQEPTVEGVFVFKSTVGKPIKIYVMEAVYGPDVRNIGAVPADARQDMLDYILSDDNIVYGATDAWPLVFSTFTSKVNDVLRRRQAFVNV
jgi:hypothetical protein